MLTLLQQIIQEVSNADDFVSALNTMVKCTTEALSTQVCSLFLLNKQHSEYVLAATAGLDPQAVGQLRIPVNAGLIGMIGEREEPLNTDDAAHHPRYEAMPLLQTETYSAFLGAPIIYQRQMLGVLAVQQEAKRYDESEESLLITLTAQFSVVIAHAQATGAVSQFLNQLLPQSETPPEWVYTGSAGAPGIAIGTGVVIHLPYDLEGVVDRVPDNVDSEIERLEQALHVVREDLRTLEERLHPHLPAEERALFDAYLRMLDSADLGQEVADLIRAGNWAPGAVRTAIHTHVRRLESLDNAYLRERAEDIKDLGRRVLAALNNQSRAKPAFVKDTILIGESISATDLAEVPEGCLAGVISVKGSTNSHVAILARALKVPTVMGVSDAPIHALQDKRLIVDGYYGQVHVSPSKALCAEFERLLQAEQQLEATLEEAHDLPAVTLDGNQIMLYVNAGLGADISIALSAGAEGVGLYRTEVPFLMRDRFPSSEAQRIIYKQLLTSFAPRPVIMRTLDIGGDKPLPYFPIKEDNPFLGWRGIRISLDQPEIFLAQMRAMLRASEGLNNLRIMFPMIADVTEVDEALYLLRKSHMEVREEGYDIPLPQVGVMIEVPSAVYQTRALAKRVDFLSVGSNDLTQYLLAVDRNNARVATLYDALHPAVLRALIQVVEGGHQEGRHVSICGEIAGDPAAALLLLGMGFDSLSMNAASIGRVRWTLRHVTQKMATKLLQEVLSMESAIMIRCHMELALERAGLGNLVRIDRSC